MTFRLVTDEPVGLVLFTAESEEQQSAVKEIKTWANEHGYTVAQSPEDEAAALIQSVSLAKE